MQAIVLAAGKGSRLGKYTKDNTKCMLEINGQTLIVRLLEQLSRVGVKKVILVVGYKKENLIRHIGNAYKGIDIEYVVNSVYNTTNNIYSLFLAKDYLLKEDTLLIESDLIFEDKIFERLLNDNRKTLAVVDSYKSWMDGTVVKLDDQDNITSFIPKKFFNYNEVNDYYKTVNVYKFSKEFSQNTYVPFLEAYSKALGNNEYYEQVLRVVAKLENQELRALRLDGEKWYEIDDVQDKSNAEVIFAPDQETKLKLIQQRYGGYWRYPYLKDFCYLVNPYFPTKVMNNEMKSAFDILLSEYPSGLNVQNLLAGKMFNVEPENILVGNGAAELIKALSKVITGSVGITFPTFNEYPETFGYERVVKHVLKNKDFSYSENDLFRLSKVSDNLLLINPDNPSGNLIEKDNILKLLIELKKQNKRLILDESFIDFANNGEQESLLSQDLIDLYPNLILIKSISKSYGVPGARLGVLVSSDIELINNVRQNISIWNINSFGEFFLQIIGKYKKEYVEACNIIRTERERFFNELNKISYIRPIYSEANYFLCEVTGKYTATQLTKKLLFNNDVFIKDLTGKIGFENKEFIRIAVRDSKDNDCLIELLKQQ